MARRFRREIGLIVAWLVFPLVPVILEDKYSGNGPDPREWGWESWVVAVGPLLGYGFLAGATIDLPDEIGPQKRGLRRLLSRRSVWVAIGPWCGPLVLFALFAVFVACAAVLDKFTPLQNLALPKPGTLEGNLGRAGARVVGGGVDVGFGSGGHGDVVLRMALACQRRAAAGGTDRPVATRILPWPVRRVGFRRLALWRFLGSHVVVAKPFLRSSAHAADRRGGGTGGDNRL